MADPRPVEPIEVARLVEQHVESELSSVRQFVNREVFDESGVYALHSMSAEIYALGFSAGSLVEQTKADAHRRREREKAALDG